MSIDKTLFVPEGVLSMCGTDDGVRLILCPTCGSEGRLIVAYGNDPDNERYEECPDCHGACEVLVSVQPIDLYDLETGWPQ